MLNRILASAALVACAASPLAGAQTLVNGDFSQGYNTQGTYGTVPTGWSTIASTAQENAAGYGFWPMNQSSMLGYYNAVSPVKENYAAGMYCNAGGNGGVPCSNSFNDGLQQKVTDLVAGHTYSISFWTNGARNIDSGGFQSVQVGWDVSFGGVTQQGNRATTLSQASQYANTTYQPWVQSTLTFVATSSEEMLTFLAKIPPQGNPQWTTLALADVRIADVTPVPEPATLSLMFLGIAGLLAKRRSARARA